MVDDNIADDRALREQSVADRRDHEATSMLGVSRRLLGRFPGLGPTVVHQAVHAAHVSMTGPIRDFVPLLVEHNARNTLEALAHHPDAV